MVKEPKISKAMDAHSYFQGMSQLCLQQIVTRRTQMKRVVSKERHPQGREAKARETVVAAYQGPK